MVQVDAIWLDLGRIRVVHARWHEPSLRIIERQWDRSLQALQQFVRAATKQDPLYDAIEVSLKGPEISLVEPPHGRQCRP